MYNCSETMKSTMMSSIRPRLSSKWEIDGAEVDIQPTQVVISGTLSNVEVGNCICKCLTASFVRKQKNLSDKKIKFYLGINISELLQEKVLTLQDDKIFTTYDGNQLDVNVAYKEYVPMGVFNITEVTDTDVTAYDNVILLDKAIDSSVLNECTTSGQLLTAISTACGVTFNSTNIVTSDTVNYVHFSTYREIVAYIAKLNCCNAYADRDGVIQFGYFTQTDLTITDDMTYTPSISEDSITYGGVISGTTYAGEERYLVLPEGLSQERLNGYVSRASYTLHRATFDMIGLPFMDSMDIVSLGDDSVCVMDYQLTYDGGLKADITCNIESNNEAGVMKNQLVEKMYTLQRDVDGFKQEYNEKITNIDGTLEEHQSSITQNASSITSEVSRATAAEGTLQSSITQTADAISAEVTRATEAEGNLSTLITTTADGIKTEVSKTYATKTQNAQTLTDAKSYADTVGNNAIDTANSDTDDKLENYSTTTEINSAIEQTAESITTSVSATYATKAQNTQTLADAKSYADDVGTTATSNANNATDEKLTNYSTTAEMNTAIEQTAEEINATITSKETTLKTYADTAANNAIDTADGNTDDKLADYSTTTEMNTAINAKAGEVTVSVNEATDTKLGDYYTKTQADAKVKVATDAITSEVTRATDAEDSLQSQITQNANSISAKVSSGEAQAIAELAVKDGLSSFTVDADKIDLTGYTTVNEHFQIDENGNLKLNDGTASAQMMGGYLGVTDSSGCRTSIYPSAITLKDEDTEVGDYLVSLGVANGTGLLNMAYGAITHCTSINGGTPITSSNISQYASSGATNTSQITADLKTSSTGYADMIEFAGVGSGDDGATGNFVIRKISSSSDKRIKKNIAEIKDISEKFMQLKPVSFDYIDNTTGTKGKHFGFIAQDVEKLFPQDEYSLVSIDNVCLTETEKKLCPDGRKEICYTNLHALEIAMIQKQQREIDDLKALVNQLLRKKGEN